MVTEKDVMEWNCLLSELVIIVKLSDKIQDVLFTIWNLLLSGVSSVLWYIDLLVSTVNE